MLFKTDFHVTDPTGWVSYHHYVETACYMYKSKKVDYMYGGFLQLPVITFVLSTSYHRTCGYAVKSAE